MKKTLFMVLLAGLTLPSWGVTIYPMNGGDLRRENHSLAPTSIANPLQVKWISPACTNITVAMGGPIVLTDRVIQCFDHGMRCVDRSTGTQLWLWPCPETELYFTPTYDPDLNVIYVCRMDGSTVCLSPQTGQVLWYFYENSADGVGEFCSPVYLQGKLYVGNGGAGFACLDTVTHNVLWRFDFSAYLGTPFRDGVCTPAYDNGYLYFTTRTGHFFCLKASDGSCVWHVYKKSWKQNGVLLSDQYVYSMGFGGDVECRNRSDGSLVWNISTLSITDGNLALCGSMLIIGLEDWRVLGVNMYTGKQVWSSHLGGNFARSSPFVACGKVYVSACHGDYYGLDGQTGKVEWQYHHGVPYTFVDWAEADGNLFVANEDGRIFCFEPVAPGNPATCLCNLDGYWTASPTATSTPTWTSTPTPTATVTPTSTLTLTPTITHTLTITSTPTLTLTSTVTSTQTITSTATPSPTLTLTATITNSPTVTRTPTDSTTPSPSPTASLTPTFTSTPSGTASQTSTNSFTPTGTASLTSTPSASPTGTQTPTPTSTSSPSQTPSSTCSPTPMPGANCTLTQGYWKNHSKYAPGGALKPWPLSEDTLLCGMTWYNILLTPPEGQAWYILAHQWIAAKLNAANGASVPPEVQTAITQAGNLLIGDCGYIPPSEAATTTSLGTLLDDYNNGLIGPGHCASDSGGVATPVIYPNPANGSSPVYVQMPAYSPATDIKVRVFTVGFREVVSTTYPQVPGDALLPLSLTDQRGTPLANGLYFVRVDTSMGHWTGKLLVLR